MSMFGGDNASTVANGQIFTSVIDGPISACPNGTGHNISQPQMIAEVLYLTLIVVLGTIGNLTVIFSIVLERRVHMNGNIFVINLAIADLLVRGVVISDVHCCFDLHIHFPRQIY